MPAQPYMIGRYTINEAAVTLTRNMRASDVKSPIGLPSTPPVGSRDKAPLQRVKGEIHAPLEPTAG